MIERNMQTTYR